MGGVSGISGSQGQPPHPYNPFQQLLTDLENFLKHPTPANFEALEKEIHKLEKQSLSPAQQKDLNEISATANTYMQNMEEIISLENELNNPNTSPMDKIDIEFKIIQVQSNQQELALQAQRDAHNLLP